MPRSSRRPAKNEEKPLFFSGYDEYFGETGPPALRPKTADAVISYEYPLSERVRTLLRLEDLFERVDYFLHKNDPHEHHVALLSIFEILEVSGRADLKSDLLQELERQKHTLESLRENPDVSEEIGRAHV